MEYTNKSIIIKKFGGYDCLLVDKYPLSPLEGKIEVQVKFCGLNFADLYTRLGLMPKSFPFVLGMECSGIVTKIGDSAETNLKVGDHVICYNFKGGMYSDVVRVDPSFCFFLPENIPLKEGTTLFVNYLTAYFALLRIGNLQPKETVVIKACAGGVGWAATQLARSLDTSTDKVTIIGVTSKSKEEVAKGNGVDYVLNYDNFHEELKKIAPKGVDLFINNETTTYETDCKHLKPLGRVVILGSNEIITNSSKISTINLLKTWWKSKKVNLVDLITGSQSVSGLHLGLLALYERDVVNEVFAKICDLYERQKISPKIDSTWKFHQIVEATKILAERRNVGKVILEVN